jgi:TPR repeat protein
MLREASSPSPPQLYDLRISAGAKPAEHQRFRGECMSFKNHSKILGNADVIDIQPKRRRGRFYSFGAMLAIATSLFAMTALSWWGYSTYLKPSRDQKLVDEALAVVQLNPERKEWGNRQGGLPVDRRLIIRSSFYGDESECPVQPLCKKAARAALDIAIRNGSAEARIELGKGLRDGVFGEKDLKSAASAFESVLNDLQPGIKTRDHDSLYAYSLMLREGLGVSPNIEQANALIKEVALTRDQSTMKSIGISLLGGHSEDPKDLSLAKAIFRRLIDMGDIESYALGVHACTLENDPSAAINSEIEKSGPILEAVAKTIYRQALEREIACSVEFAAAAAKKGDGLDLVHEMASDPGGYIGKGILKGVGERGLAITKKTQAAPLLKPAPPNDPEAQNRTGYLKGTKQTAQGGLSTFKVDNTKGGGDAVVRLYRDGKKPAARSMFVKNGESFIAEAISPGEYKMRYRYVGSQETFEADETFQLTETATETGTRFSRMTVTLFKVANGNMSVKLVNGDEF